MSFPSSISHLKNSISKTDDDGELQIYSYDHCDNSSSDELKKCRGLIFNNDNLLFGSLGFTPEYTDSDSELSTFISENSFNKYLDFSSEEGTMIRVFYFNKWYVSTHRKLDAFKSRWGSKKSFGDIFVESIKEFGYDSLENLTDKLNHNNMYMFFIRNTIENKIVSNPPVSEKVYYLGSFVGNNFSFDVPEYLNFPQQKPLMLKNWESVLDYVKTLDPREKQGVLLFTQDMGEVKQVKILSSKYKMFSQVRGNEPNLLLRYIQVRSNPIYSKMIYELYPEQVNFFIQIENIIVKIAKNIHNSYVSRFVNKNYTVVSQEEYVIIKDCHGWHISDRSKNKVTLGQVINVLNKDQYVGVLYTVVNRYLNYK
jgi:hypothetical protein